MTETIRVAGTDLEVHEPSPGLPASTVDRLDTMRELVKSGAFSDIIDILLFTDAMVIVAREKRASEAARDASRVRIEAARRLGELLGQAPNKMVRKQLEDTIPNKFWRCTELAAIPQRLFDKTVAEMLSRDLSCTVPTVIRFARRSTLKKVEHGIYEAFDGSLWVKTDRQVVPTLAVGVGDINAARKQLERRSIPHALAVDEAFSRARWLAQDLSRLGGKLTGAARKLVGEAELKQAEVAEALDKALKAQIAAGTNDSL